MNSKELDYINILKAIESMPFRVGKNLLIDFMQGSEKNDSIKRNRLNKIELFGCFELYSKQEIDGLFENLLHNGLIAFVPVNENKFMKVIELTSKGEKEIIEPSLYKKKLSNRFSIKETAITDQDRVVFDAFDFFLKKYNDDQKKAIISEKEKIMCIAGAGSGKTTVLTKRIEFLTTFRSIAPERILAITFTRKARTEMVARLSKSQYCIGVHVETFNSFCEKIIKEYNNLIYEKSTRVMSYSEKIRIFRTALKETSIEPDAAIRQYFSVHQSRDHTNEELLNLLMNDCYSVIELYKMNDKNILDLKNHANSSSIEDRKNIEMICKICLSINTLMKDNGLRDYSDQIKHCIEFFRNNKNHIPYFEHVLVDEFQDVNSSQINLLDLLNSKNLFCVGDPRQSIFGWRGSKIGYILNFEEKYPKCEIINLSTNYRSKKTIVDIINRSIENSNLADLRHFEEGSSSIHLINFDSEDEEIRFVVSKILELNIPRNEIFVLARTNRIIAEVSNRMKVNGIKHLVKTENHSRDELAASDEVVLATVHSIKGLEADTVFIIGCTGVNFPCKASDHPIIELIRVDDYDKEEEERRLFYVALSRAKNNIYMTYSGKNHTRFINQKMLELVSSKGQTQVATLKEPFKMQTGGSDKFSLLKQWRKDAAQKLNVPAYMIMHDKTLLEIIEMNPLDVEDLNNVRGIGPAKLKRFGKEIIDIMNMGK